MKTRYAKSWKSSKQPRKQRKYRHNAPKHIKIKFLSAHLSKSLREKYNRRSAPLRKGDKVKVMRGNQKNKIGKVDRVDLKKSKVYVAGIEVTKKDGNKVPLPLDPSNLVITELFDEDKKRISKLKKEQKEKKSKSEET